jgi:hypothetical protein
VDAIAIGLTLESAHADTKAFAEMINLMKTFGFRYFDEAGSWRTLASGRLEGKNILFVRQTLF